MRARVRRRRCVCGPRERAARVWARHRTSTMYSKLPYCAPSAGPTRHASTSDERAVMPEPIWRITAARESVAACSRPPTEAASETTFHVTPSACSPAVRGGGG
eukprot:1968240-Prymnesium_polylepis.1